MLTSFEANAYLFWGKYLLVFRKDKALPTQKTGSLPPEVT